MDKERKRDIGRMIGATIKKEREARGITQDFVAESLGIGVEAVSRIERGTVDPTISRLVAIADVIGCGLLDLLFPSATRHSDRDIAYKLKTNSLDPHDQDLLAEIVHVLAEGLASRARPTGRRQKR